MLRLFIAYCIYYICTESSKGFERKPFRVFLMIKNHWCFEKYPREFTDLIITVCFYLKTTSENIVKTQKVYSIMENVEPI